MAKRFTDTQIWEEDWFLALPPEYMLFWKFITDACDHAGIWKPNKVKFQKLSGCSVDHKKAIELFNNDKERVSILQNGRWFLTGFIPFQYGEVLNLSSRLHNSVYELLILSKVKLTSIRPQIEVIERVKDKEKEKIEKIDGSSFFDVFWKSYPKKVAKGAAEKALKKVNPDEQLQSLILRAIERAKTSDDWLKDEGRYIPHPSTWLNQRRWEDEGVKKAKPDKACTQCNGTGYAPGGGRCWCWK